MMWKIAKIGSYETTDFAALELKRYLSKIDPSNDYMILDCKKYDAQRKDVLWVGYTPEFPVPEVEDAKFDDGISINVKKNAGYITGTNGRSVLIAVYRFLRELGCGFVRPGEKGEVIPARELKDVDVKIFEKPSYRHRVICIDGNASYDNLVNMIDWLPKIGMNGFFNQDHQIFAAYSGWYKNKHIHTHDGEFFTTEDSVGIRNQTVHAIKNRGLIYHAGAHKWMCEPFGVPSEPEGSRNLEELPREYRQNIALIDGKREIHKDCIGVTNLCYTTKFVQDRMAEAIVDYCKQFPEVDVLHFWLADGCNNHCECENCKQHVPSDLYVDMLNRVDEELTKEGIEAKVSLLIYDDLLWAPQKSRVKNADRFILQFAPITRDFSRTISDADEFKGELPPYVRNKLDFPTKNSELVAHLKIWQAIFDGDSDDFDYHFMWNHYLDFGYHQYAKLVFDDMAGLDKIGLNGMVSCQTIRCFMPSALGMIAMAEALWNKNADFDIMADNYYLSAFGKDGREVKDYLSEISDVINFSSFCSEWEKIVSREMVEKQENILARIDEFVPVIEAHASDCGLCDAQRLSWRYLIYHAELCKLAANTFLLLANGEIDKATEKLEELKAYPASVLKEIHDVFDDSTFQFAMNNKTSGTWYWARKSLEAKNAQNN